MVLPMAAAAQAAGAAGQAGATALGLSQGKTDLDLTRDLFKLQMRQAKRLWTADWAEASVRHGEQCMQSAQQHAEAQAMAMASFYQAEKLASQSLKLARDQDSRAYEMAWRAEVRESLRDELANQYNRYNIVMLCDTVCLGCVFSLVAEGSLPENTSMWMLNLYVGTMGLSITLFSISLWFAVIVVRRLQEHTAATLERKLFVQSEDLQKAWQLQLIHNLPTGPHEIYLVNQAYEKWVAQFLDPVGAPSIHMMAFGVVMMFITAGLLTHNRYLLEFDSFTAASIFWAMVGITSTTVLYMKYSEDRKEKKKQGVYDNSWQDQSTNDTNPYAKISRAADELFHGTAVELASTKRMELFGHYEQEQRHLCTKTESLHGRVQSLCRESEQRTRTRKDVLQLLTTAAEELDALPEELTGRLNKLLYDIDKADRQTADLVSTMHNNDGTNNNSNHSNNSMLDLQGSSRMGWSRLPPTIRQPMAPFPIDAQKLPVSLASVRRKLGESALSTLLRIKNLSDEPLRLKSGVQLKEGKYIQSFNATDPNTNTTVSYHLYPSTEIPPRSEIIVAAKNAGRAWLPISGGIEGEIVYTNLSETWLFRIKFSNQLVRKLRTCQVTATHLLGNNNSNHDDYNNNSNNSNNDVMEDSSQFWNIQKDELDIKANNEVAISIDVLRGDQGRQARVDQRRSHTVLRSGMLLKNKASGLGLQWQQRWVVLTPTDIICSEKGNNNNKETKIAVKDIIGVQRRNSNMVKNNVFEIHTRIKDSTPYKFSAATPKERDDWIQAIMKVIGIDAAVVAANLDLDARALSMRGDESTEESMQSVIEDGFECVESDMGISVWPI